MSEQFLKSQEHLIGIEGTFDNIHHIAFSGTHNYIKYIGVAIFSILKNNPNKVFKFHILTEMVTDDDKNRLYELRKYSDKFGLSIHYLITDYFDNLYTYGHFSSATYYRFALPSILKNQAHTVLYLDADVLCTGKLDNLLELNIDKYIAAAHNDYSELGHAYELETFGFPKTCVYFNAGVMLINIDNWHSHDIDTKIQEKLLEIGDNKLTYLDQDVLNIVLANQVFYLSERYNWRHIRNKRKILDENSIDICIVHYSGYVKPWHTQGFNRTYHTYYSQSPWANFQYESIQLKKLAPRQIRILSKDLYKKKDIIKSIYYYLYYIFTKIKSQ
ncbi:glycosyltransferase family 8 protein [Neisseriaceae bacterium B1]